MTILRQSIFILPEIVEVARTKGLLESEGLDVQDILTPSSAAQRDELAAGRVDLAITSIDNLLAWNTRDAAATGAGLVQVAQIETTTDLALVARADLPGLGSVERLRLAVDAPTNGFAVVAYAMLRRLGVEPSAYQALPFGGVRDRYHALLEGAADLTLVAPPLDALGVEAGMTVLMRVADLAPCYPGLGVVVRRDRLEQDDAVMHYVRALDRARGHMASAPPTLRPATDSFAVLIELRAVVGMSLPDAPAVADLVIDLTTQI